MGKMDKWLLEVEKHRDEEETRMKEAIEVHSVAEDLCADAKDKDRKAETDLLSF